MRMKDSVDTYDKDHNNVDDDNKASKTGGYDEKIPEAQGIVETSEDGYVNNKKDYDDDYEEYEDYSDGEDDYEEYEDYGEDEDEDEDKKIKKIIIISILIAALIAAAGIFAYQRIKASKASQAESPTIAESQSQESQESPVIIPKEKPTENQDMTAEQINKSTSDDITKEQSPIPTATPKPLPTATPSPEPTPDANENVTGDAITGLGANENYTTQNIARVIFLGDSRFREMANYVSANDNGWECSSTGDYEWLTSTAYTNADKTIGEGTKIFINIGLNDLTRYADYAASINTKAQEWKDRGASVYFVAIGPVESNSDILNQDIINFNTYMYQNLKIPFIDAYNYLVENGFETSDGKTYTVATCTALYTYLNSFL